LTKVHWEDQQNYPIAFLDDKSRSVMCHEILADKSMAFAAKEIRAALAASPRPYQIIIDDRKQVVGFAFQKILADTETLQHRTHLYSPEENGKSRDFGRQWKPRSMILNPVR
jgi:hypothetical protein